MKTPQGLAVAFQASRSRDAFASLVSLASEAPCPKLLSTARASGVPRRRESPVSKSSMVIRLAPCSSKWDNGFIATSEKTEARRYNRGLGGKLTGNRIAGG